MLKNKVIEKCEKEGFTLFNEYEDLKDAIVDLSEIPTFNPRCEEVKHFESESIVAKLSFKPSTSELIQSQVNWSELKSIVASDFLNLNYSPCHIYVYKTYVIAVWFLPNYYLVNGLQDEEICTIIATMKKQLKDLVTCKLIEIKMSSGIRKVGTYHYSEWHKTKMIESMLTKKKVRCRKIRCKRLI